MKRLVLLFVVVMLAVPVVPDQPSGKVVWKAQAAQQDVASISETRMADGSVKYHIWYDKTRLYQEYPLNGVGYNGSTILVKVREIRPFQDVADAAVSPGMRDPSSIYRSPRVVWGSVLEQDGAFTFIEVRECGENYLIVVTTIIPQRGGSEPKTKEL